MKLSILVMIAALSTGCSSTDDRKRMFMDGATACNEVCKNNPSISEVSSTTAGGIPLLFMGGMETQCRCYRTDSLDHNSRYLRSTTGKILRCQCNGSMR